MKAGYGTGVHDSKVEDYNEYKEKQFKFYKDILNAKIDNISSSSLSPTDKVELLEELKKFIDSRITKQVN